MIVYPPSLRATDKDWLCLLLKNSASSEVQQQFWQKRSWDLFSYRSFDRNPGPAGWGWECCSHL
eukprot:COSAG01_NODE_4271_length_5194_cov_4.338567_3_plen_64_part_00